MDIVTWSALQSDRINKSLKFAVETCLGNQLLQANFYSLALSVCVLTYLVKIAAEVLILIASFPFWSTLLKIMAEISFGDIYLHS